MYGTNSCISIQIEIVSRGESVSGGGYSQNPMGEAGRGMMKGLVDSDYKSNLSEQKTHFEVRNIR